MALLVETVWGDLVIDLDIEGSPILARNILKLAKARFYTKTLVYRVVPNRFCQAGCPVGDGSGGTSIFGLLDEPQNSQSHHPDGNTATEQAPAYVSSSRRFIKSTTGHRVLTHAECREKGRVVACLTHTDIPDTIGSQFSITTSAGPDHALDGLEGSFLSLGRVVEDDNGVLEKINAAYVDGTGRPYADIRILRALVIYDPFDDPPGMEIWMQQRNISAQSSPSPERPREERVPQRISIADVTDTNLPEEVDEKALRRQQEDQYRREDHSRAVVLEMLGDLPSADIRAPENVLFICKLNPVTLGEDLELIFSRFDPAVKVEVIRDFQTGQSLQYAFAEFTTKEKATEAYFKMNNALVDDRRIKVDFSQSVSKLWDKYNQRMRMPKYNDSRIGTRRDAEERELHHHRKKGLQDHPRIPHSSRTKSEEKISQRSDSDQRHSRDKHDRRRQRSRRDDYSSESERSSSRGVTHRPKHTYRSREEEHNHDNRVEDERKRRQSNMGERDYNQKRRSQNEHHRRDEYGGHRDRVARETIHRQMHINDDGRDKYGDAREYSNDRRRFINDEQNSSDKGSDENPSHVRRRSKGDSDDDNDNRHGRRRKDKKRKDDKKRKSRHHHRSSRKRSRSRSDSASR